MDALDQKVALAEMLWIEQGRGHRSSDDAFFFEFG
jgi:hypothetical protein